MELGATHSIPPDIPGAIFRSHLGSGGFADVFLYQQSDPLREVAVKVLKANTGDKARQIFLAEANIMAKLSSHPSIVTLFGTGTDPDSRPFMIMESCPVRDLSQKIRQKPLSLERALEVIIKISGAVETMHRLGLVHHDIKPSNILFTEFQQPVLSDFGIATYIGAKSTYNKGEGFSVPWAPPEQQIAGTSAHPSADIYALGATLYTFLVGTSPFEDPIGDNSIAAFSTRVRESPVPRITRRECPDLLEQALAKSMAKNPAQRYSSALEFAEELQKVQILLRQPVTHISVVTEVLLPTEVSSNSEDATRITGFTTIDPDATRVPVRSISAIDPAEPDPEITLPPGSAPVPGSISGPAAANQAQTGYQPPSFEFTVPPEDISEAAQVSTPVSEITGTSTANKSSKVGKVIKYSVALVAVIAVVTLLVVAILTETGRVITPDPAQTTMDPMSEEKPNLPEPVSNLTGMILEDRVYFTWQYPDRKDEIVFLYEVADLDTTQTVGETTELKTDVPLNFETTCLKVFVKAGDGRTSSPVQACIAQSE